MGKYDKYVQTGATGSKYDKYLQAPEAEGAVSGSQAMPAVNQPIPQASASPSPYTPDMIDSMYGKPTSKLQNQVGAFADRFVNSATFGNAANINTGLSKLGIGAPDMGRNFKETKDIENIHRKSMSDAAPVAGMAGDIAGFLAPGVAAHKIGAKVSAPVVRAVSKFAPAGAGMVSRAARYGGRVAGVGIEGAAQFGLYQGTVGASNKEMETGETVGAGESLQMAKEGATDPLAWAAGPALSGIFRVGKYARSGGQTFTPDAVAARVNATLTPGRAQILNADQFGVIEPQAEKLLFRLLADAGYTRDDITSAVNTFEQSVQGGEDLAMLPSRLKDMLVDKLGDGAKEAVDGFLQGAANRTGTQGAASVGAGVTEDAGRLSQFVKDSAQGRFGSGSRFNTLEGAEQELSTIGQQYETLFSPGAVVASPQDEQALKKVVDFYSNDREISKYVAAQASKMQMTPQAYIEQNPRRAAHLMQQVAREIVDENPSPTIVNAYSGIRDNLLKPLEASTPGYNQVRNEFGDEYGFKKALTFAGRFFSKAEDDIAVGQLAKEYAEMTPRQQDAAKLAMRDEALKGAMRRTEGGAPRLSILEREGSLAAMERVFGQEGAEFSNDIRTTAERMRRTQRIASGTGSNTMNKQQASEFAESAVSNKFVRSVGNALQNLGGDAAISGATGFLSPVMTGRAMIRGAGNALAQGRQGKIDKLSGLLMKDAGARPRAQMSGDGPVPTPTATAPGALAQGVTQSPPVPAQPPAPGGGMGPLPPNSGPPSPQYSHVVTHQASGESIGFKTRREAEAFANSHPDIGNEAPRAMPKGPVRGAGIGGEKPQQPLTLGKPHESLRLSDELGNTKNPFGIAERVNNVVNQSTDVAASFAAEVQKLQTLSKAELLEVAAHFTGGNLKGYSKPELISAIERKAHSKWIARQYAIKESKGAKGASVKPEQVKRHPDFPGNNKASGAGLPALRGDAGNALIGGAVGAAAPADSTEERARNALAMAGASAVAGRVGRRVSPKAPPRSAGIAGKPQKTAGAPVPKNISRPIDDGLLDEIENYSPVALDDLEIPSGGQTVSILLPSGSKVSEQFPSHDLMAGAMTDGKIKNLWELGQKTGLIRIAGDDSGYEIFNGVTSAQKRAIMRHYDETEFLHVDFFDGQNWISGTFREGDKSKLAAFLEGNKGAARGPVLGAGFTGSKPPKPPKPKGRPGIGTRSADAAAIGAISLQGQTAEAEGEVASSELKAANERVTAATQRLTDVDGNIEKLQSQLAMLQDTERTLQEKQQILVDRGRDLGTTGPKGDGVDGVRGVKTRDNINAEMDMLKGEIAYERGEREKGAAEIKDARKGVTDAQMRQSLEDAKVNPFLKTGADLASGAAFLGGIYLAGRGRKAAVKDYTKSAKTAATKANKLVNSGKLYPKANTGPNSTNVRASNLNEFWKQGGAKGKVPFDVDAQGNWRERNAKNAFGRPVRPTEPSKLFKAPRYLEGDKKFIIAAGIESQATKAAADHFRSESEKAQAEMDRAYAAGDSVAFDAAVKSRNMADGGEAFFRILERLGYGLAAGRTLGGLKKYPAVNANTKAASSERALILQGLKKQKAISAKANDVNGNPKP